MSAATIREAQREDRDACLALWKRLQDEHEPQDPRLRRSADADARWRFDFDDWVTSAFDAVFVAERDGAVVGLVTAHPYWPAPVYEAQQEVYVTELYVEPGYRREGIARHLVAAVRAWAQEQGASQLRVGVLAANEGARRFWERVGASAFVVTMALPVEPPGGDAPG